MHSVVDAELVDSILHKPASPRDYECLEVVVERFSFKCFHIGKVHVHRYNTGASVGRV